VIQEDRPKKKVKVSSKGLTLSEFLPPPSQRDMDSTEGLLGGGYAKVLPTPITSPRYFHLTLLGYSNVLEMGRSHPIYVRTASKAPVRGGDNLGYSQI